MYNLESLLKLKRKIFVVWFGPQMSKKREKAFNILKKHCNVPVILVTDENLKNFILQEYPLHEGFWYLNEQNKSDYIRSYLLHHYGGGYSDIKPITFDWNPYFEELENSHKYILGSPQPKNGVSRYLSKIIREEHESLIGACYYIAKQKTTFTEYWVNYIKKMLDAKLSVLKQNDGLYHIRAVTNGYYDENHNFVYDKRGKNFPFGWAELQGKSFHFTQYKFKNKIIVSNMPLPSTYSTWPKSYR